MSTVETGTIAEVSGTDYRGTPHSLLEYFAAGRYTLVWWQPQVLRPSSCRSCSGGAIREPIQILMDIHSAGCDVVGLTYDKPNVVARYLQDIGLEYPILSVDENAARAHGVAKVEGEPWPSIPHRVAFLVDEHSRVVNRYAIDDPTSFLRAVRDDVRNGPPVFKWEKPKRKKFLGVF